MQSTPIGKSVSVSVRVRVVRGARVRSCAGAWGDALDGLNAGSWNGKMFSDSVSDSDSGRISPRHCFVDSCMGFQIFHRFVLTVAWI